MQNKQKKLPKTYKLHKKQEKILDRLTTNTSKSFVALCNLMGYNSGCKWWIVVDSGKLWWVCQIWKPDPFLYYEGKVRGHVQGANR